MKPETKCRFLRSKRICFLLHRNYPTNVIVMYRNLLVCHFVGFFFAGDGIVTSPYARIVAMFIKCAFITGNYKLEKGIAFSGMIVT